jgi:hypothetical protein
MSLEKTKEILNRLIKKFGDDLKYTRIDIQPQYGNYSGKGYPYDGIEDRDRDTIYNSIGELMHLINNPEEGIQFDIENVFITEKKAIIELKRSKKFIEEKLAELTEIQKKYSEKAHYPIQVSIGKYSEVNSILQSIFDSSEFKEFENPDLIDQLKKENFELQFAEYWRKRKWKYRIHFLLFVPFLIGLGYTFLNRDSQDLTALNKAGILLISSFMTVLFNYLFNNHISFKDAWKLFFEDTREELKKDEREKFKKAQNFNGS